MEERGRYGPRATKSTESSKIEIPRLCLSRKTSITSSSSTASRLPTYTSSWFSKARHKQSGPETTRTGETLSSEAKEKGQATTTASSSKNAPNTKESECHKSNLGLGISSANTVGLGNIAVHNHNTLRRKAPSYDQRRRYALSESSSSHDPTPPRPSRDNASLPADMSDPFPEAIFGVGVPELPTLTSRIPTTRPMYSAQATSSSRMASFAARQLPDRPHLVDVVPSITTFTHSSGSESRLSDSPGAFSQTSTPTSLSSHSPGITLPVKSTTLRTRQISPTRSRPPVTRRRVVGSTVRDDEDSTSVEGLSCLKESITSSSSSSTLRGLERVEKLSSTHATPHISSPILSSERPARSASRPDNKVGQAKQPLGPVDPRQMPKRKTEHPTSLAQSSPRVPSVLPKKRSGQPPSRPSREGTPNLDDRSQPSPVVQSNLQYLATTGHTRRESLDKVLNSPRSQADWQQERPPIGRSPSITSTSSIRPSRLRSPLAMNQDSSKPSTAPVLQRRAGLPLNTRPPVEALKKEPSLLNASSGKATSRFGFFSLRTKSPSDSGLSEVAEKPAKKGPAAGTGHEGYNKYRRRGRTGSMGTSASRDRSTSSGSTSHSVATSMRQSNIAGTSEPEMDDFLRERLAPVVISGGGKIGKYYHGTDLSHISSKENNDEIRLRNITANMSTLESRGVAQPESKETHWINPSVDNELDQLHKGPTLAARRSLHRSQLGDPEPIRIPNPIKTALPPSPSLKSHDTLASAIPRTDSSLKMSEDLQDVSEGREGNWFGSKQRGKRARSPRKWNFFHRSQTSTQDLTNTRPHQKDGSLEDLPATISKLPFARPVAHYAMLDSNETSGAELVEDLMSDVEDLLSPQDSDHTEPARLATVMKAKEQKLSMLLPSPPQFPVEFQHLGKPISRSKTPDITPLPLQSALPVQSNLHSQVETFAEATPKISRLAQVGRIPRVISKRDRLHKPPPQSFSRPFARSPGSGMTNIEDEIPLEITHPPTRPVLAIQTKWISSQPSAEPGPGKPASAPVGSHDLSSPANRGEFLIHPPRNGSDVSGSSSSGVPSFVGTTAIPSQPESTLDGDEVWNEYDELLDNVLPRVASSSIPAKSPRAENRPFQKGTAKPQGPIPRTLNRGSLIVGFPIDQAAAETATPTRLMPPAHSLLNPLSRTSQLSAVQSPLSFTDLYAGYADRQSVSTNTKRESSSTSSRYSVASIQSKSASRTSHDDIVPKRHTQILAEKIRRGIGNDSNLRPSALMTSRWLSFGRVLFSPAHDEIRNNRQDRVLVLDGLGNDDWSFYCALNYPTATIYNLSTSRISSIGSAASKRRESLPSPPSNHRQIHHASAAHPFPFPKGFFTAVVFRFPMASSEAAYQNAVSESKRVLRPGGYLEMSILDIDMINMGNRVRREVRSLKVRMQIANPDISLKPASDTIQQLLGRHGFENLNRCMLEVPAAGLISSSRAGSFDEKELSLGDMLKDESKHGDEGITKMVARVARWWYSRCYERGVIADGQEEEGSIWADKAVIRECERRETGFKFWVGFAQKPVGVRRRTISV